MKTPNQGAQVGRPLLVSHLDARASLEIAEGDKARVAARCNQGVMADDGIAPISHSATPAHQTALAARTSVRFPAWLGYWLSLAFAVGAFGAPRFAASDITQPDFFPILPWDPYHGWSQPHVEQRKNGFGSLAECHFNMAGFVLPKDLPRCEKLGLGAIMLPTDPAFTNFDYLRTWKTLSDEQIESRVKQMVQAAGRSPAVMGYFITDEPGVNDFPALCKAVAAVRKYAPRKLAYINLFPDYATLGAPDRSQLGTSNYTDYLERFVAEVRPQVISYDNYMVQYSDDLQRPAQAASYYRNLLEIRRVAQKYRLPYLNIVCANQIRLGTPIPSPANLLFQAYTTVAAGCRGVTWYNYYGPGYHYTAIDSSGAKSLTWVYLDSVNSQVAALAPIMSRLTSTGVFFSAPGPAEGLPVLPGELVEAVTCPAPMMIGEFRHAGGDRYVMLVNLSLERSAKFTLKTAQQFAVINLVSSVDGAFSPFNQSDGLWLVAGQGALLRLEH
jgi:hypothetical protein